MGWEYYRQTPPKPANGIKAKSKRGDIGETWWSKRWVKTLESFNMGARLTRGRSYARRGQVVSLKVKRGVVTAQVQGTRERPYAVRIKLPVLSDEAWEKVTSIMASQALFAAKLLSGEMPKNIEEAFEDAGVSLFPESRKELNTSCSCPDWANPCKHVAAVYYLLAEQFDQDPFLIFKLRGRTKEEIIKTLREKRGKVLEGMVPEGFHDSVQPLEECVSTFWEAGEELNSFVTNPVVPVVENVVLKRLGDAPFEVGGARMTYLLSMIYDAASTVASQKALEDEDEF